MARYDKTSVVDVDGSMFSRNPKIYHVPDHQKESIWVAEKTSSRICSALIQSSRAPVLLRCSKIGRQNVSYNLSVGRQPTLILLHCS